MLYIYSFMTSPKIEQRTFADWSNRGYLIIKGSKSVGRNDRGECLFSSNQVTKKGYFSDDEEESWEDYEGPGGAMDFI